MYVYRVNPLQSETFCCWIYIFTTHKTEMPFRQIIAQNCSFSIHIFSILGTLHFFHLFRIFLTIHNNYFCFLPIFLQCTQHCIAFLQINRIVSSLIVKWEIMKVHFFIHRDMISWCEIWLGDRAANVSNTPAYVRL